MSTTTATTTRTSGAPPPPVTMIGVAQLRATNDKVYNLLEIAKCVAWAKQKQTRMLFLPENCGFMGEAPGETLQQAEPPVGEENANTETVTHLIQKVYDETLQGTVEPTSFSEATTLDSPPEVVSLLDGIRTLARRAQMWISVGGLHVRGAPPHPETNQPRFYNTHLILDDTGAVQAIYRKIHLFDVCIPGKVNLMESNSTAAGQDVVLCDTPVGKKMRQELQCGWKYDFDDRSKADSIPSNVFYFRFRTTGTFDLL